MQMSLPPSSTLIEDIYEKNQIHFAGDPAAHSSSVGQLE